MLSITIRTWSYEYRSTILFVVTNAILFAYFGNVVKARKFEGVNMCNGQKLNHQFIVINGSRTKLLGHKILSLIFTDWLQYFNVQQLGNVNKILNNLCQVFSDVFGVGVRYDERDGCRH